MLATHSLWPLGTLPFAGLLLAIAILPLIPATSHWWHSNRNKTIVAASCGFLTLLFLSLTENVSAAGHIFLHTLMSEYIPFMALLGSLYIVAGGIALRGDLSASPKTNTIIIAVGALLASVLGTTGASVLLIRLLLDTNRDRTRVTHTVVFFIFLVSNVGGLLLPIGDPPLFLGYLRGVPFFWTLQMWPQWLFTVGLLLVIYFSIDSWMIRHETAEAIRKESTARHRIHMSGLINLVWLGGILASVIVLVPGRLFPGTNQEIPIFAREVAMCLCAGLSLWTTPRGLRTINKFSWGPILEVAALFIGIFVAMQVPLAVLTERGAELGVTTPAQFFWVTGTLSSFLDNAPTYLVFLTTATTLPPDINSTLITLNDGIQVSASLLVAISLGSVFMGATSYIGNGPNFMVKAMAEEGGVRMPSFFGYMAWAAVVLIPVFILVTIIFEY
ncbi:MAG: sodium:proton antiporter [Planctomycetota bacterium]|nr:sodium:proton antiporter [Planctomycetota bacterium]